jgi:hypothetical protein
MTEADQDALWEMRGDLKAYLMRVCEPLLIGMAPEEAGVYVQQELFGWFLETEIYKWYFGTEFGRGKSVDAPETAAVDLAFGNVFQAALKACAEADEKYDQQVVGCQYGWCEPAKMALLWTIQATTKSARDRLVAAGEQDAQRAEAALKAAVCGLNWASIGLACPFSA